MISFISRFHKETVATSMSFPKPHFLNITMDTFVCGALLGPIVRSLTHYWYSEFWIFFEHLILLLNFFLKKICPCKSLRVLFFISANHGYIQSGWRLCCLSPFSQATFLPSYFFKSPWLFPILSFFNKNMLTFALLQVLFLVCLIPYLN